MAKIWFVTGSGQGLGRAIVEAALARGDSVAASTRKIEDVLPLVDRFGHNVLPLALDVRDRAAAAPALAAVVEKFGRIDVVVNNAARALSGALEELTEDEVRDVVETNLLGTVWVTQAALPIMRAQADGHIIQVSSGGGVISWPLNGAYQATKFGIDGLSESLAQEATHLGIKVTIAQVGHMGGTGLGRTAASEGLPIAAYAPIRETMKAVSGRPGNDPHDIAPRFLQIVDAETPPLRVLVGRPLEDIKTAYEDRLRLWAEWEQAF
jgi:NAD(P)-dependent dehydrogenase (short-subunit alcohol dehydrogenase family)